MDFADSWEVLKFNTEKLDSSWSWFPWCFNFISYWAAFCFMSLGRWPLALFLVFLGSFFKWLQIISMNFFFFFCIMLPSLNLVFGGFQVKQKSQAECLEGKTLNSNQQDLKATPSARTFPRPALWVSDGQLWHYLSMFASPEDPRNYCSLPSPWL